MQILGYLSTQKEHFKQELNRLEKETLILKELTNSLDTVSNINQYKIPSGTYEETKVGEIREGGLRLIKELVKINDYYSYLITKRYHSEIQKSSLEKKIYEIEERIKSVQDAQPSAEIKKIFESRLKELFKKVNTVIQKGNMLNKAYIEQMKQEVSNSVILSDGPYYGIVTNYFKTTIIFGIAGFVVSILLAFFVDYWRRTEEE